MAASGDSEMGFKCSTTQQVERRNKMPKDEYLCESVIGHKLCGKGNLKFNHVFIFIASQSQQYTQICIRIIIDYGIACLAG